MTDLELETISKASLGFFTEGSFGTVHTLSISWPDAETTDINWSAIQLCRRWRLKAKYSVGDTATLILRGWGDAIPVAERETLHGGVEFQLHAIPTFEAEWELDAWGVGFFIGGVRQYGYFALLAATNEEFSAIHRPIVAYLRKGDSVQ